MLADGRSWATVEGNGKVVITLDTDALVSPSADRPGDARELSFVMQASRVRIGQ